MEKGKQNHAVRLGIRVGSIFLLALCILIGVVYYILSQNFHARLTDYSIKLVQAMVEQGVTIVEYELQVGKGEAAVLADSLWVPEIKIQEVEFPEPILTESDVLRMVYVSEYDMIASDGRQSDIRGRQDIITAFEGETSVFGPYYNEEQEFVICYSAPVRQHGNIVGVLSVEKDGYRFCELIEGIQFVDSGESYIINSDGTDIAVSR